MKIKNYLVMLFCFVLSSALAQTKEITGTVVDDSGIPLPGANVIIKGTTTGTLTDFDGKFAIEAAPEDVLVFSYIGYETIEALVGDKQDLVITLAPNTASLDEVVVVGYGTQKKSVTTGAISSVKAEELEAVPNGRIEQALQGRVSGVTIAQNSGQPGSSATVRVRGLTTFDTYGGNSPLWVVDGVIVDSGGIGYLNQQDIESIEVLKDAASLAIYGARAASGVILVTTKKGKKGLMNMNYTGYYGVSAPEKTVDLLNASQYAALMNEKSVAAGGNILYPDLSVFGTGTDWQNAIFNDSAMRESHEFSLSGGNDVSTFYASFGLLDTEGIVTTAISQYQKKSLRLNSTHKFSDMFTVGQTFGYTHQKNTGLGNTNSEYGGPLSSALNLDPITPLVETDPAVANSTPYLGNPVFRDANGNPYGISGAVGQEMTNPVAYVQTRLGNYSWSDDFVGNAYVEFRPIEQLTLRSSVGGKIAYWGGDAFTPVYFLSSTVGASENSLSRNLNQGFGWNIENTLSYGDTYGKHDFTLLLGQGTYVDGITSGTYTSYQGLPVDSYRDASFNYQISQDKITASAYTGTEHRVISLFSRLNYNYDERYLFTGIVRRDGSTNFGSNNKFGVFPSFSAGWNISNEEFWNEESFINTLKLRAGYGVTGNDAIKPYGYLALIGGGRNYTFGRDGSGIIIGYSPDAPPNPDLKWEETSQLNVGVDARLFRNLTTTIEYYKKVTTGILQEVELPGYVGSTGLPVGNVADMENRGLEFELGFNKNFGDFYFSANGNLTYLENEVTYLGQDKEFITTGTAGFQSMGPITRTQIGQPYNSFYGFRTAGIFQTISDVNSYTGPDGNPIQPNAVPGDFRWVDTNGDGTITDDDKQFIGSPLPDFTFGLTLNMNYKNFDFMLFTQGAAGNQIFQGLRRLDIQNANYSTKALSRWRGAGTSNDYPRLTNEDTNENFSKMSDFYLEDGDYLRVKLAQVGYTIPKSFTDSYGIQNLRFYVTGENLLTLTDYTGYDPEIGGNVLGIDRGYYPQARSFLFGANLQF
ncbi:SusC/RagA family TonB-linked outer membrane protein [Salinimicrobium oceani]|uniref:TonB-dependent receptor n=1 Tax=Salinimicrobium oceani TaxID=2722702 RepID=A0ABX1CYA3_9FLAO|nr:TonB-dependent receptor [Salinimicrobium oceani]NJW52127.1 TonB-dependent receptor [Salinimicrobium oceani]